MVHFILLCAFAITTIRITGKYSKNYSLLLAFSMLLVFAALRYDYGNDYWPYFKIYIDAQNNINSAAIERLYFELNRLFPSFQLLIATLSFIYLFAVYKLITRFTDRKQIYLSVFIFLINPYLFILSLSSLRQTLVCSLFLLSLMVNANKKWVQILVFFGTISLSCFIHQTAILLLPFYFVYHQKKQTVKHDYLIFSLAPVVLLAFHYVLYYLISKVLLFFPNNYNYLHYLQSSGSNSLRSTLLFAIFYIYILLNLKRLDEKAYPVAKLYLFGLLFALLTYQYSMFGRFQMYFDVFGVVAIPAVIKANLSAPRNSVRRLIHLYAFPCAIFAIFALRYYSFFTTELWSYFREYHTILFK